MVKAPLLLVVADILKPLGPVTMMATNWRAAKPEPMMVMGSPTVQTEQDTVSVAAGVLEPFPAASANVIVTSRVRRTITLFIIEITPKVHCHSMDLRI
jgi:hypothetical protein